MRGVPAAMRERGLRSAEHVWRRIRGPLRLIATLSLILAMLFVAWPYAALWNLHLAVMNDDRAALASLVDMPAVRDQIARRLNKDRKTVIGDLSDAFIEWIEIGIRRSGPHALESQVTLDWVQDQLIAATAPGLGFLSALSYCFFDSLEGFVVRMQRGDGTPLTLRLQLEGARWRVTAVYY